MSDPRRLIDSASPFEEELLNAGRSDAMSQQSRNAILTGLGLSVAAPAVLGGALSEAHAATRAADGQAVLLEQSGALGHAGGAAKAVTVGKAALGKGLLTLFGGGLVGLASIYGLSEGQDAPPARPVAAQGQQAAPTAAAEQPEVPGVDVGDLTEEAEPEAIPPASKPRTAHKSKARSGQKSRTQSSAPTGASLADELALLDSARSALGRGQSSMALAQLQRYRTRYPSGRLRAEASVLHIEILTAQGKRNAANKAGERFLKRSPSSPYSKRVRSLLGDGS